MNLRDQHTVDIPISEISLFESQVGITSAFQIREGAQLNNQKTQVPTLLICVEGKLIFQNEQGKNETLISGDFININPKVAYNLRGLTNSQLLLIK